MPQPMPQSMSDWLGVKYGILGKEAEGQYQRNIAEAREVAPNAASLRALQGAQTGFIGAQTDTISSDPFGMNPTTNAIANMLRQINPSLQPGQQQPAQPTQPKPAQPAQQPSTSWRDWLAGGGAKTSPQSAPDLNLNVNPAPVNPASPMVGRPGLGRSRIIQNPYYKGPTQPTTGLDQSSDSSKQQYRKGTANVRGKAPGGKSGKSGGGGGGSSPQGLEQILPSLLAAAQANQMGGGAAGPQAPDGSPPPMAPGAAAPPGMARGKVNVKASSGKGRGSKGLEAMLPQLLAAMQSQGGGAPQPGGPPPMAPGPAPPPGMAHGSSNVMRYAEGTPDVMRQFVYGSGGSPVPGFQVGTNDVPTGMARGAPDVPPNPGYPFGAGYLFGATAVPGQGTGRTDTVPAMLAPHEAVLNRAAADMLGRGLISQLNAAGSRRMGMG